MVDLYSQPQPSASGALARVGLHGVVGRPNDLSETKTRGIRYDIRKTYRSVGSDGCCCVARQSRVARRGRVARGESPAMDWRVVSMEKACAGAIRHTPNTAISRDGGHEEK